MFQGDTEAIRWRLHLASSPEKVHRLLSTDEGRARFWAESAVETDGVIDFRFPGGEAWRGKVIENNPPHRFAVEYLSGSTVTFELTDDGAGGTDLTISDAGVPAQLRAEVTAGWVSVLLALKASVDFGADIRNHDASRTWDRGFADN